ncbi:MAG TPA: hypothetical protein VKR99_04240 [Candidatus Eremiobacteraceae bacterium]|nr:hypothetical protein [Candidatus Eremiobacteraceae bacterium]
MPHLLRFLAVAVAVVLIFSAPTARPSAAAKPAPSPSPSPTNPPTPYMPVEQVTNGTWQVIMQPRDDLPSYSTMKLTDLIGKVSGVWQYDKKTTYVVSGTRDGSHLKLDLKRADKPDVVVGSIDAVIDGIADMFGTITLNGKDTPFQGAQHSRVPPPVEATPGPNATPTPY